MLDLNLGTSSMICDKEQIYFCEERNGLGKSASPKVNRNCSKSKASRRKLFNDEENMSPVLGLRILPAELTNRTPTDPSSTVASNRGKESTILSEEKDANIGKPSQSFGCKLCQKSFEDPLQLANHRCVRIENVQYVCSECGKTFNCPANLASHRRWHKPKKNINDETTECNYKPKTDRFPGTNKTDLNKHQKKIILGKELYPCHLCGKEFSTPALLKAHAAAFHVQSSICSDDLVSRNVHQPEKDYRDKPTTIRRAASHSTGAFYQETAFGGLAALAYAAEMHPIMFPFRVNNPATNKRLPSSISNVKRKEAKLDTQVENFSKDTSAHSLWLPPSPPRSDLSSCSPRSSISDDTDEKCKKATTVRIAAPTPPTDNSHVDTNPEKQAIVRPMPAAPTMFSDKAFFGFPPISHGFHQKSLRAVTNSSGTNVHSSNTFLNFHEPYHPYVYSGQQKFHYSTPPLQHHQQWNSLPVRSTTAWETSIY